MKDTATFRKQGLFLAPSSRDARDIMAKLAEGERVFMQVWKPRNMAQHRKYFAILNNVVEATGKWTSTEHLRKDILIALRLFDEEVDQFTGEIRKIPHSMAVASMKREAFERLYDDTIRLLTDALGCDPELLLEEAA
mgnify:FL=1